MIKYTKELMEDMVKWYGLEAHPEFQLEVLNHAIWKAHTVNVKLPKDIKAGIKSYKNVGQLKKKRN